MKISVLGSGMVGRSLGRALASLGHEVVLGTRDVGALLARGGDADSFAAWAEQNAGVGVAAFSEAAAHGTIVFNATSGGASLDIVRGAASELAGKVLVDVANPLDFSQGMPPSLSIVNTDSLGEQIQAALPDVRVVKALNTVNADVMVDPQRVAGGDHDLFVCGNDAEAKAEVTRLLQKSFGWQTVHDLGDITAARAMEMYLPLWVGLMMSLGTPMFNVKVVR